MGIQSVAVDGQGFLWTAGAHGVCRFDGADWFCPEERAARTLHIDSNNAVWSGLADGTAIVLHPPGRLVHVVGQVGGTLNDVAHSNGVLWLATSAGLFAAATNAPSPAFKRVIGGVASKLLVRRDAQVLVATGARLLLFDGTYKSSVVATFDADISAIAHAYRGDATLVGTTAGTIHRIVSGVAQTLPAQSRGVIGRIRSLCEDGAKTIWIGTDRYLHSFNLETAETFDYNEAPGLPHNKVTAMALDEAVGLWLITPSGLAQMRLNHPLRSVTRTQGMLTDATFSVTGAADGTIWAATSEGVAGWKSNWTMAVGPSAGLPGYDSRTVVVDPTNTLWIGSLSGGLYAMESGRAVKQWPADLNLKQGVRALRARRNGGLWVGLHSGGMGRFVDGKFTSEFQPRAPGRDLIFDMIERPGGKGIWLALSHDGLALLRDGRLERFGVAQGLPASEILSLATTNDDQVLWIGTNGGGLARFDGARFSTVSASQGLISDQLFGLTTDETNTKLWMSAPLGIGASRLSELHAVAAGKQASLKSEFFGMSDGVPGEPVHGFAPAAFRGNDGTVWFPTLRGLVNIDPRALAKGENKRPIAFDDVQVNGHSVLHDPDGSHPSLRAEVTFKFASPEFDVSRQQGFRYQLEGLQEPGDIWHAVQHGREARYQNVPPGSYRFRVQKLSKEPLPLVESTFPLVLPKPWHATYLFRGCVAALLLMALVAVDRKRVRRIEQTHEAVLSERSRIARDIHDSLEQDLSGLRLQIEAAALAMTANPQLSQEHLARASELITDGVVDLRNSIWGLKSSKVKTTEIVQAVSERLHRLTAGTAFEVDVTHVGDSRVLPPSFATHVVHVAREAVTNAIKHARAKSIAVTFETSNVRELVVRIKDDGVGIVAKQAQSSAPSLASGQGLTTMQTRAKAMGGRLEVESGPSRGTTVILRVPTKSNRRNHA